METNLSIYEFLKKYNPRFNDFHALVYNHHKFDFDMFCIKINQCANYLTSIGVKKKDVITIVLPNIPQMIFALYAASAIGAIINIIHPLTSVNKIREYIKASDSKYIITLSKIICLNEIDDVVLKYICVDENYYSRSIKKRKDYKNMKYKIEDAFSMENKLASTDITGEDILCYLHSSGTSGEEKTVVLTHEAFNYLAFQIEKLYENVKDKRTCYTVLPLFHGYALCSSVHFCLTYGIRIILDTKYSASKTLKQFKKHQVNYFFGVPFIYEDLMKHKNFNKKHLNSIIQCYSGAEKISINTLDAYKDFFQKNNINAYLLEGYGLTEVVTACAANTPWSNKIGSCGKALFDNSVGVFDGHRLRFNDASGEIYVATKGLMVGYLNEVNQPFVMINKVKYLKTGDFGYIDINGYLFFKSRVKNIIIRKGVNIFPSIIEEVVLKNKNVKDAVVIEDNKKQPVDICLFITLNNYNIDNEELKVNILDEIKKAQGILVLPQRIYIVDKIPKNKVGKTNKEELFKSVL